MTDKVRSSPVSGPVSWSDEDYARAKRCMIEILRKDGWFIHGDKGAAEFDNAFQHAVGILSLCGHAQSPGWQPIETAPKDREILVWSEMFDGKRFIAKWNDNRYASKPRPYWSFSDEQIYGTTAVRNNQPTHWTPLPQGPDTSTLLTFKGPNCGTGK